MLFIHKFQPMNLRDFMFNDTLISTLHTYIALNNLNILFIGAAGSGKTTLINALVRDYYGVSNIEGLDNILHINNLKDQGIQFYRSEVKTFCQTKSSIKHKKRIIILDDIDLITEQSQQVFRNCIDKYSSNVHFISSCNNIQKVIESLQSRFNLMKINSLGEPQLYQIMNKIITTENIQLDEDAKKFILTISNNTVKTVINYLEKIKLINAAVNYEMAVQICTDINFLNFNEYILRLREKNICAALIILYEIYDKGYSVIDILDNFFIFVKNTDILAQDEKYAVIEIICKYITIFHTIHELEIELAVFSNNLLSILKI